MAIRMPKRGYFIIVLVFGGFLFVVGGANQDEPSFELEDVVFERARMTIKLVVVDLKCLNGREGMTHYCIRTYVPTFSCWFIEGKVVHDYFERDKNGDQLKVGLLNGFRRDLDKPKSSVEMEEGYETLSSTPLYHEAMEEALRKISQADPSSLTIFRTSGSGLRAGYRPLLGIIKRGTTEQPCVYQGILRTSEPTLGAMHFRRNLVLGRDILKGEYVMVYYQHLDDINGWILGGTNINSKIHADVICFYPLP